MRGRVFDPHTGTFLELDPAGLVDSTNPYAGFAHDTVNNRDPTGRFNEETARAEADALRARITKARARYHSTGELGVLTAKEAVLSLQVLMTVPATGVFLAFLPVETLSSLAVGYAAGKATSAALDAAAVENEVVRALAQDVTGLVAGAATARALTAIRSATNLDPVLESAVDQAFVTLAAEQALAQRAASTPPNLRFVYRALRPDELATVTSSGLTPKDSRASKTIMEHVFSGSEEGFASQFVSTTRDLGHAARWGRNTGYARIDLCRVKSPIIDLSTAAGRKQFLGDPSRMTPGSPSHKANAFAKNASEVLIEGPIPPEAIIEVTTCRVHP
jgi:hypothetical protein